MLAILMQNAFDGVVNRHKYTKMLLEIPFPMNHVIIDLLAMHLVDIYFDNTKQILLLCFAKSDETDYSKNCQNLSCKILYINSK